VHLTKTQIQLLDIFTSWLLGGHTHNESQANVKSSQVDEEDQGSSDSDNNTKELAPVDEEHNIGDVSGIITGIEKKKLMQMSLNTGLAIAIHNFPEGVATFVAAMDNPRVGAIFAIAIAIHNIPEGFAIALPIYYGTGNPWKAFFWGALSGATEPVAAFFAWLVLGDNMGDITFGVVFGVVAGMMVMVAVQELLPAAHRYDPDDEVASKSLVGGMAFMALSLILFAVTE
jgi:zinc transporter ZupT